jgi:hypothetical protein
VPVLALFLLVNILWGVKILKDIFLRKGCYALMAGIIVAILWASNLGFCNFLARAAVQNGINHFP